MKRTIVLWIAALFFVVTACKKEQHSQETHLTYSVEKIQETFFLHNDTLKPGATVDLVFTYPTEGLEQRKIKKLQQLFVILVLGEDYEGKSPKEALAIYCDDYCANREDLQMIYELMTQNREEQEEQEELFLTLSQQMPRYLNTLKDTVTFSTDEVLSLRVDVENYMGGAHGSRTLTHYVINVPKATVVTEEELFVEDYFEPLKALLLRKVLEQNNAQTTDELQELGYINAEGIVPNGNFSVDKEGITYHYGQYEIACYAMGMTDVFLSYNEIRFILKKENPISGLMD